MGLQLGEVSTFFVNDFCGSLDYLFSFIVMKIANIVFEECRDLLIAKSGNDCNANVTDTLTERFFGVGWLLERCEAMDVNVDEDGEDAMGVSFGYPVVPQSMVGKDIQVCAEPSKD